MSEALHTTVLTIDAQRPAPDLVAQAAALLRAGRLVAFPTETVYGLGANALDADAVRRIFAAKQRPAYDPLIVHVTGVDALRALLRAVPPVALLLADHFWPGPLTLVAPRADIIPAEVTAGGPTVALRAPSHPVAQALLHATRLPIAAPSANLFSHTSPTTAAHVWEDLAGRIDLILDAGPTHWGVESTVLDVSGAVPVLLRPGGVTLEALRALLGRVDIRDAAASGGVLPGPGLLERHYAPRTRLLLAEVEGAGAAEVARAHIESAARAELAAGRFPLLLAYDEDLPVLAQVIALGAGVERLGAAAQPEQVAARLYAALRAADALGANLLLARTLSPQGLGAAVNDRLRRAAGGKWAGGE
jgi:L-threonylcarbamoyladenylate synthase